MNAGKFTFFRQSSWMVFAITGSGVFMYAVHIPALAKMPEAEYGLFATLLQILNLMLIPSIGLQTIFTQQTAAAIRVEQQQQLTGTVRSLLLWTFLFWMAAALIIFLLRHAIVPALRMQNPAALWITVLTGLPMLWLPIMQGLLQGTQNFLWLGWAAILNGVGRFLTVLVTVVLLGGYAAGGMIGAFFGMTVALLVALWQTRPIWRGPSISIHWRPWLQRVVPLTLGLGASQFMFSADMIMVQTVFEQDTGLYGAAGTIARGLVIFTGPLVMVMFPKIVRSAARSESTDVMGQALAATAFLGGLAALACTMFPELPFRIMNKPGYLPVAPLIPWFAWAMLPLALSNVLLNNLLARSAFAVVPWLVLVAAGYGLALLLLGTHPPAGDRVEQFKSVVQMLGAFNLLFLALSLGFTWKHPARSVVIAK